MKKYIFSLLFSITFSILSIGQSNDLAVKLRSGDLLLQELDDQLSLGDAIAATNHNNSYFIVQFDNIPTTEVKSDLANKGIAVLEYLPEYAFIANLSNAQSTHTLGALGIRGLTPFVAAHKFPAYFDLTTAPDYIIATSSEVRLMVDKQEDISSADFANFLEANSIEIEEIGIMGENFKIILDESRIDWLKNQSIVKFIDYAPAPPEKEDDRGRSLHRANMLDSDDPMGRHYTGNGVSMAIADDDIIGPHIDIKGRVTQYTTANNNQTHGDMTSGIAMGAGNLDPTIKGMATKAYLHYYQINGYPHINQAATNYTVRGVVVTSTSYSQGCNAGYTSDTRSTDLQVGTYTSILHVFSAGNSASSSCAPTSYGAGTPWGTITGGIKQGKSVIATGNLEYNSNLTASSSRGPAADGRIKPDICANGTNQMSTDPNNNYAPGGGTSAAAPGIAGLAAQMYEGYRAINGNMDPPSSLIKASMLNTARDLGNRGPDFFYGWGRVNAHRAMLLLEENRYINASVGQNGSNTHTISVSNPLEELKVMVYWNDFPGTVNASKALINDLNIKVVTPNNDTLYPWVLNSAPNATALNTPATKGIDNLNNMEQVSIDTARAGTYTVIVEGATVPQGPQSYHLLWETISDTIAVTYPAGGESFVPGETETIRWDAEGNVGNFTVEYSINNGSTWATISSAVPGSRRYHNWNVPNLASGDMMIRVSRNGNIAGSSRSFNVFRQPNGISTAYTCPDSVQLSWNAVPGAISYDIYQLGAQFMDSVGTTTGTTFNLYNLNLNDENWWALRANGNGIKGRRTFARLIPNTVVNCPIDYDFAITQIVEPATDYVQNCSFPKIPVRITINNAGDSVLTNIPVKLRAGNLLFRDTIPGPLQPGVFQFFTFRDSIPMNTPGALTISAINDFAADQNPTNDSVSKSVNVISSTVFTVPYSNDFENFTLCSTNSNCGATTCILNGGWTNISNNTDAFDMRVNSGGTPSANTGPITDQNPGTALGKYIYSEASTCFGVESEVLSPCFDLTGTIAPEFSFWYHMNGANMGIIRMDLMTSNGWVYNIITPLFGNQGNVWRQQTINLSSYVGQVVSFRFRITTGSSFTSDLAIDNVELIDQGLGIGNVQTDQYRLFPNPSNGQFNIILEEGQIGNVNVFDLQGRNVYSTSIASSRGELDLNNLEKGIYIIEFNEGRREKILIQ